MNEKIQSGHCASKLRCLLCMEVLSSETVAPIEELCVTCYANPAAASCRDVVADAAISLEVGSNEADMRSKAAESESSGAAVSPELERNLRALAHIAEESGRLEAPAATSEALADQAAEHDYLWQGRPPKESWTKWFARIESHLGRRSPAEARTVWQNWLRDEPQKCDDWKLEYEQMCKLHAGNHENPQALEGRDAQEQPSHGPVAVRVPREIDSPEVRFTSRVTTVRDFCQRWSFLGNSSKASSKDSAGKCLREAQDRYLMYLDVISLLDHGHFDGQAKKAAEELKETCVSSAL